MEINLTTILAFLTCVFACLACIFAFLTWRKEDNTSVRDELRKSEEVTKTTANAVQQIPEGLKLIHNRLDTLRKDTADSFTQFRTELEGKFDLLQKDTGDKIKSLESQNRTNADALKESMMNKLEDMRVKTTQSLTDMRDNTEKSFGEIRKSNDQKLEQMRATVDEKLQKTLEARLEKSFNTVSEQLKNVHQDMGKMKALSENMEGLKRALTSAPVRGALGENILEGIIRQMLSNEQYQKNIPVEEGSRERVDFAIFIPESHNSQRLLPVDSKFPMDDYKRYVIAKENSETDNARKHKTAFLLKIKAQAKSIHEKYIRPPHTTDIAVMFLPNEGLYAVVASEPGMLEQLHEQYQVRVTGPHNFAAMLDAIRIGQHLFTIGQRSNEVWKVLSTVKTEFDAFSDLLRKAKDNLRLGIEKLDKVTGDHTHKVKMALEHVKSIPESPNTEILNIPSKESKEQSDS